MYAALLLLEAELILVIFSTVYVWKQRVLIAVSTSSPGFDFKYHFPHLYQFCDISDKNVQPNLITRKDQTHNLLITLEMAWTYQRT